MNRRELGTRAEDLAVSFLRLNGCEILARGYRHRRREIDIIAREGGRIVFVEVKFRRNARRGLPRESVGREKQEHIVSAARAYLAERGLRGSACRFDVVEIRLSADSRGAQILQLAGAFGAEPRGGMAGRRW